MLLAMRMSGFLVCPIGSKRVCENLFTYTSSGTPYCKLIDTAVPKQSIKPPMVLPSLAMVMNSSPGRPSSYRPTVM